MNYKRVLVTGASGLIGRSVVRNLLKRKSIAHIIGFGHQKANVFRDIKNNKFSFIPGDCRDYLKINSLISKCDSVIHLAAPSSYLLYKENPQESTINTIESFLNILELMKKNKIKKIVHASSCTVYKGNNPPYKEKMKIISPGLNGLAKRTNEEMAKYYSQFGINSIALRLFSVYGEGEESKGRYANAISKFTWAMISGKNPIVWGNGQQTRDFIHADDVAKAFCLALEKDVSTQVLNVGTGIETSLNEIIKMINNELGLNLKPRYTPLPIDNYESRSLSDNSKVESILGFKPKISLKQGVKRIVKGAISFANQKKNFVDEYFQNLPKI